MSYVSDMSLAEKILKHMNLLGLSQQLLAERSGVSDSEVSRLLNGRSKRPGLQSISKLAHALGVSIDYLADDSLENDPHQGADPRTAIEWEIVKRSRELGTRDILHIIGAVRVLGIDLALRRLYGIDGRIPGLIETPDHESNVPHQNGAGGSTPSLS